MLRHKLAVVALAFGVLATRGAYGRTVRLYWDISGSLDPDAVASVHSDTFYRAVVSVPKLTRIELYPFATIRQALTGKPAASLDLVIQDMASVNCGQMSKGAQRVKAAKEAFERECETKRAQARVKQKQQIAAAANALKKAVQRHTARVEPTQSCIDQVIARSLAESPDILNIVVTDGWQQACASSQGTIRPLFSEGFGGAKTIMVLLASQSDADPIAAVQQRMDALKRRAPKVTVIPYTQLHRLSGEVSR